MGRNGKDPVMQRLQIIVGAVHQPDAQGLARTHRTSGIGQLAQHAVADDPRQTLQGTHIGGHPHVDFLDAELCVFAAISHVTRGDQINGTAHAIALYGGQHRFAAAVHGIERGLHLQDLAAQQARIAANVLAQLTGHRR